jgi:hypothetical protein
MGKSLSGGGGGFITEIMQESKVTPVIEDDAMIAYRGSGGKTFSA